ncbi:MAG TPA: type II secretion system protein GspM [Steroidobacteraceae bacterium]|jgi:general secretion pathway protein M|nr:type II secretion system protein GspM [Steroidobacteraceae bacterium]
MDALLQYYARLGEREQRIALFGGIAALILLTLAVLLPLQRHVGELEQRLERKRDDLVWLRSVAPQLAGLRNSGPPPMRESLVVVIDRSARQSGLERALVGSQPSGDGGLNVRLEQTSFDGLVSWLSQLRESYGVRVDSAVVEAGNAVGTVNASLVLHAR